jgi:ABC-type proline/glycine betaine transport system substrate-binding protein
MSEPKKKSSGGKIIVKVVVCLLFGLALAVGIPKFIQARQASVRLACMNHLIQIDGAKQQWKIEHKKTDADIPTWEDLKPYLSGNAELKCPAGGIYTIGKVGELPSCSITNHSLQ